MQLTGDMIVKMLRAAGASTTGKVASPAVIASLFNDAIEKYGDGQFTTVNTYAALVSESMMESAWFATTQEYASTGAYQPYRGRTFIQITWKDNYAAFGKWCLSVGLVTDADYFVENPSKLADLKWAAIGGVWYFTKVPKRDLQGNPHPIVWWADEPLAIGRAVNMGNPYSTATPNGQKARDAAYFAVVKALTVAPPVPSTPTPEPLMHSSKWGTDYVSWRGGNFPPQTRDKLLAIPSNVGVTQGGLSWAPASAMTHAGLGAFDLNTDGKTKAQVWQQVRELLSVGVIAFPRGFNYDSFQGKTISNTNDGNEHLHCLDTDEYDHLHPEAQSQVNEWKKFRAGQSKDGDGLVGSHPYYGPGDSLGKWADSPWNPVNIAKKELELPSVQEVSKELATDKAFLAAVAKAVKDAVLNADEVPNTVTSNAANANVTPLTNWSQVGKKVTSIEAKIDALAAAVAAAFPEPTPEPAPPAA
jgi:hypothetical protein